MTAARLLDRLESVKQTATGRWIAKCPSHEDQRASLSVRELDDGRVLVHDFAGCDVADVLIAAGLTFDDLFPPRADGHRVKGERRPFPAVVDGHKKARGRFRNRNAATGAALRGVIRRSVQLAPTREAETGETDTEQRERGRFGYGRNGNVIHEAS